METKRDKAVTIATDSETSNILCNMAWDKGLVVIKNLIDYRGDSLKEIPEMIKNGLGYVYAEDLRVLGRSYSKISETLLELRKNSIPVIFPDWELDPLREGFYDVIKAMDDLAKHDSKERSRTTSIGMTVRKHVIDPPKKRKLPMKEIAELRLKNYGWATISKMVSVPRQTLIDRRKDIDEYMEKNGYFDRRLK